MAVIDPDRSTDATGTTIVIYLVWFFLGNFGVHRLVTGRVATGLLMLVLHGLGWLRGGSSASASSSGASSGCGG